jgi:hypothetical protein
MGEANFSFKEITRNESLTVGTSAVTVSDSRQENNQNLRKVITVRNISPNDTDIISVFLSDSEIPSNNKGIVLRQYESFTDSADSGYIPFQGKISAICATANGVLSVFER